MDPVHLDAPLSRLMASLGAPRQDLHGKLVAAWPEVVGMKAANATRPSRVIGGTLTVQCAEAAWAGRLRWSETQIRDEVNARFPSLNVQRVAVRVGR